MSDQIIGVASEARKRQVSRLEARVEQLIGDGQLDWGPYTSILIEHAANDEREIVEELLVANDNVIVAVFDLIRPSDPLDPAEDPDVDYLPEPESNEPETLFIVEGREAADLLAAKFAEADAGSTFATLGFAAFASPVETWETLKPSFSGQDGIRHPR